MKHARAILTCPMHSDPIALDVTVIREPAYTAVPSYRLDFRQTRVIRAIAAHRARYTCRANFSYVLENSNSTTTH